jgi:hypothetical protein
MRYREVLVNVDRALIVQALTETRCNISNAAAKLGVPPHALRRATACDPEIIALAIEEREQLCDRAEEVLYEAINDFSDAHRRDVMARFVLSSEMARGRGFSPRAKKTTLVNAATNVIVGWADSPGFDATRGYDPADHGGAPEPDAD